MDMIQDNSGKTLMSSYSIPIGSFVERGAHNNSDPVHEHLTATFPPSFLPQGSTGLESEDWLTYENFSDLLHSWPFDLGDTNTRPLNIAATYKSARHFADLQESWYTHLDDEYEAQSGYMTPMPRHGEIDDNYRQSLHRRLQISSLDQNLPSVEFMNLCVKSYFGRFHHLFPIVHAPTFRPLKTNAVLLLSICSVGSLLTGYPSAYQRGTQLFERLHKAILADWDRLIRRGPEEALAMVQASIIGQTFALLSGQAKYLSIVDAFHGTIISWARRMKIFQIQHALLSDDLDLDKSWKIWVHNEEKIRVALGLRIHDAEIASILRHETLLPSASRMTQVANDTLFAAQSAQEWVVLYKEKSNQSTYTPQRQSGLVFPQNLHHRLMSHEKPSQFTIYTVLEDVCCEVIEARINESLTVASVTSVQECLLLFFEQYLRPSQSEPWRNGIRILWHYLFILLHSDMDLLERSIGRDGPDLDATDLSAVQDWAKSASAKRCVAHAIMIKRNLEDFPLSSEPAIHVPRCAFSSIICLFCYAKYSDGGNDSPLDFPEFQFFSTAVASLLKEAKGSSSLDIGLSPLYGFVDLLQRIGHWGISRTLASLVEVMLQAEGM